MLYLPFLLLVTACEASCLKTEPGVRSSIIPVLEKVTVFMENRYQDINLDAVLGFRVLQGIATQNGMFEIPAFLTLLFTLSRLDC